MPCFIKLSNHVIEAVPKVQLLNHSVILNNVKNLNTFIVCLQILRCSQNDKKKIVQYIFFGQSPMVNITLKIDITHEKKLIYCLSLFLVFRPLLSPNKVIYWKKYRSMAVEYNHDLKAADKHISASIELEKAAQKDLRPKLSGDANFQYTGNPIRLTLNLPSMQNPLTFEGKDMKYGTSLTLLQPVYTGGRLLETIRMAKHQHSLAAHQAEYFRSAVCYQTDMQYWNTVARAELLQVATDYRNSIASLAKTIRERVEAGLVDPQRPTHGRSKAK